jgi:hypothetical protein
MNKEQTKLYNQEYYKKNKEKIKENVLEYANKNKEKIKDYHIKYREENKEKIKENRDKWLESNKDKMRVYYRDRKRNKLKEDDLFKFKVALRKRTNMAFNRSSWKKDSSNEKMLGCKFDEAKKHIESKFKNGMTWDNYGKKGWHIDHIIPLSSAKDKEELKRLCNYNNLQPLWAFDNLSKGSKII